MSNRISAVVEAMALAFEGLVPRALKAVKRGQLDPFGKGKTPALGVWVWRVWQVEGPYDEPVHQAEIVLDIVMAKGTGDIDKTILDVVAEVESALIAGIAADGGLGGGIVKSFRAEPWYHFSKNVLVPVGATVNLTVAVGGKLKND